MVDLAIDVANTPGALAEVAAAISDAGVNTVMDVDHHDFALSGHRDMRDRQRMLGGLGVADQDVELGALPWPDARGCGDPLPRPVKDAEPKDPKLAVWPVALCDIVSDIATRAAPLASARRRRSG